MTGTAKESLPGLVRMGAFPTDQVERWKAVELEAILVQGKGSVLWQEQVGCLTVAGTWRKVN